MKKNFVLGTSQLNIETDYGISQTNIKISVDIIFKILESAWNFGIRHFDTAPSYNNEKIIGEFINKKKILSDIKILTKIPSLKNKNNVNKACFESINNSLKNCNIEKIHTIFFHDEKDFYLIKKEKNFFSKLSKQFKIENFGFSVYERKIANEILEYFPNASIQFPYNVVNQDFEGFKKMNKSNFFVRSIFLQGLLSKNEIKNINKELTLKHKTYLDLIKEKKLNPLHLCLDFINLNKEIDYIIFGVKSVGQLNEIMSYKMKKNYDKETVNKIKNIFFKFRNPNKWLA